MGHEVGVRLHCIDLRSDEVDVHVHYIDPGDVQVALDDP
jgi:hypothetical protein